MHTLLIKFTNALTRDRFKTVGLGAGLAFGLGFYGYLSGGDSVLNAAYNSLSLFVVSFAEPPNGEITSSLQAARFIAPLMTVAAALAALMGVVSNEIDAFRARRLDGHILICGAGDRGVSFAQDYQRKSPGNVAVLESSEDSVGVAVLRSSGIPVVIGDGREARELKRAGAASAERIICVTSDDEVNAAIVTALTTVKPRAGRSQEVHCHIGSSALHRHLTASSVGKFGLLNVEWFNIESLAAESLVSQHFDSVRRALEEARPQGIAVLGESEMSEAIVAEAARQWLALKGSDMERELGEGHKLNVSLVSPRASSWIGELRLLHRDIDRALEITTFDSQPMLFRLDPSGVDACFVALRNPIENLETAFHLKAQSSGQSNIVVRVLVDAQELTQSLGMQPSSVRVGETQSPVANSSETVGIKLINVVEETCTAEQIEDSLIMRLARENHQVYRKRYGGANLPAAQDDWATLPQRYRTDNVRCARHHLEEKLPELQMAIAPLSSLAEDQIVVAFTDSEEVMLCQMEHERWVKSKLDDGWRYGYKRDEEELVHPDLVPWDELGKAAREKDLLLVQSLPAMIRALGFGIYRPQELSGNKRPTDLD